MNTQPLVSIVVPVYNHEQYIERALKSIVTQSYIKWELIIIDDGSTDNGLRIAEKFASKVEGRTVNIISQNNKGAHDAINLGLSIASGDYIQILNSDDELAPERLESMVNACSNNVDWVASLCDIINEDSLNLKYSPMSQWYEGSKKVYHSVPSMGFALLRSNVLVSTSNLFMSHRLMRKVGEFNSYKLTHDLDYFLRATIHQEPYIVQNSLLRYRYHRTNSFKRYEGLVSLEGVPIFRNFIKSSSSSGSGNLRRVTSKFWGCYYDYFVDRFSPWFSGRSMRSFLGA